MKRKIEVSSLLLGAFTGAVAVLCVAAATTKTNTGASGDTTSKGKEFQMEQVTGIGGVFFKVKDPKGGCYEIQNEKRQKLGDLRDFAKPRIYFYLKSKCVCRGIIS